RMLRHKAMIQCARLAFGFAGIYDQDEAERIVERDVTPAEEVEDVSQSVTAISNATSIEVLQEVFGAAWRTYKSKGARDQLTTAKDERKKFLLDQPVEAEYEEVQDGAA
ncbi:phage recombination protein Bet, partial [Pseudomonas aeruginosa]|nr:phage recombination protein Bet [Pseudomonas aeruginosa]MCO2545402.1 phage recombination protein Bet [Pseudomonas aeruginosa]